MTVISNLLARIDWTSVPVFSPSTDRLYFAGCYAVAVVIWLEWLNLGRKSKVRQAFGGVITTPILVGLCGVVAPWLVVTVMSEARGGTVTTSELVYPAGAPIAIWYALNCLFRYRLKRAVGKAANERGGGLLLVRVVLGAVAYWLAAGVAVR